MNEVLLDGSSNTIGDFNGVVVVPTQDSVEEFRVETSSYSAEFGRSGGGTVNIVTKAGTNEYHGTVYYYHQNDALNTNSFTNNRNNIARPFLRRHQYGYSLGGPVRIPKLYDGTNKTFFFTTYEGRRESNPVNQLTSVPTAAQMQGDFSKTVALSGGQYQLIQIYDPTTSAIVNGTPTRQSFPGNIIPQSRLNPIALNLLSITPLRTFREVPSPVCSTISTVQRNSIPTMSSVAASISTWAVRTGFSSVSTSKRIWISPLRNMWSL
jgi:hypothetical protein